MVDASSLLLLYVAVKMTSIGVHDAGANASAFGGPFDVNSTPQCARKGFRRRYKVCDASASWCPLPWIIMELALAVMRLGRRS